MKTLEQINWNSIFNYQPDNPLLFTRLYFWMFFLIVLGLFSLRYKNLKYRNFLFLLASLFFYWKTSGYFIFLLITTTITDFVAGKIIDNSRNPSGRKIGLWLSLFVNLGLLLYFKYTYFITGTFNSIFHVHYQPVNIFSWLGNRVFNLNLDLNTILLPVGISFYTFQSLSYVIDIYRKKLKPINSLIDYGFFVTFFPQLVAGPIVRASHFLPQVNKPFQLSQDDFGRALFLILSGLIKKIIISDFISVNFVDRVFESPGSYSGFENLMGIFGYGVQIYCDFSGYTDIAIGVALLLGFHIPDNFRSPYKARNIADFWQRWHISMTSWFRDYVFLPLAMKFSRRLHKTRYGFIKGDYLVYLPAALITFFITGLWHGAAWKFVLWGMIHGVWLVLHRFWITHIRIKKKRSPFSKFASTVITFILVNFIWVFFRSPDMLHVQLMSQQILHHFSTGLIPVFISSYWKVFSLILIALIIHWLPDSFKHDYQKWFIHSPVVVKWIVCLVVVLLCYQAAVSGLQPFIYFQF